MILRTSNADRGENVGFTEIFLLSSAASLDALSIGASCSFSGIKTPFKAKLIMCIISFAVTSIAVCFGRVLINVISDMLGRIIGAALLSGLGLYMLASAFLNREPVECDRDNSHNIDSKEACFIGFAMSIDCFMVGMTAGMAGSNGILVPIICGILQMLSLYIGEFAAAHIARHLKEKHFSMFSGTILILTGISRLFI